MEDIHSAEIQGTSPFPYLLYPVIHVPSKYHRWNHISEHAQRRSCVPLHFYHLLRKGFRVTTTDPAKWLRHTAQFVPILALVIFICILDIGGSLLHIIQLKSLPDRLDPTQISGFQLFFYQMQKFGSRRTVHYPVIVGQA